MSDPAPHKEPERQYYFIEKAKEYVRKEAEEAGRPMTFCVTTFGCQMNARDSEKLRGILLEIGYEEASEEEADFVIFNTCTVRENANTRVYGRLGQLKSHKKKNPHMKIALCGCMMQEPEVIEKLKKSYRFVDLIFGTHNIYKFAELLTSAMQSDRTVIDIWKDTDKIVEDLPVERKYPFKSGVNIMFGCNNFCTYCIVPYTRGRERSRHSEEILAEVRELVRDGVREITLLGQNVNSYQGDVDFAGLIRKLNEVEGLERIRFMTSHPKDISEELIRAYQDCDKLCNHIHLPVQAGSNRVLERMNRKYTREHYLDLIRKFRETRPDIAITTDIIVGFPGETEENFQDTLSLVREVEYDSAFTFLYSVRKGTPAEQYEDQVPEDVKHERFNRLVDLMNELSLKKNKALEGLVLPVLVEGVSKNNEDTLAGRTEGFKTVNFKGPKEIIGTIVPVQIMEGKTFNLEGIFIEK